MGKTMRQGTTISLAALIMFNAFVITPISYMVFDNQPPYEYDIAGSYVIPEQTLTGRQMSVHWKLSKINRVCAGSITRFIVDRETGVRISYDPTAAARTIDLGDMDLERTFFLPPNIAAGRKWYYAEAEFYCNPLQRFYPLRVQTPRLAFEIAAEVTQR